MAAPAIRIWFQSAVEMDGAAVLDAIAIPVAFAEMTVTLHRRAGLRTGRRWHTPIPPDGLLDLFLSRPPPQ